MNPIAQYLNNLNVRLVQGHNSEHTFRGDLESLIRTLLPNHHVTNEPYKITDCGNPYYVITKDSVPIGYIKAKDIGKDLNHKLYKEQFTRYRNALDNLIHLMKFTLLIYTATPKRKRSAQTVQKMKIFLILNKALALIFW